MWIRTSLGCENHSVILVVSSQVFRQLMKDWVRGCNWRQTGNCDPDHIREPENDRHCKAKVTCAQHRVLNSQSYDRNSSLSFLLCLLCRWMKAWVAIVNVLMGEWLPSQLANIMLRVVSLATTNAENWHLKILVLLVFSHCKCSQHNRIWHDIIFASVWPGESVDRASRDKKLMEQAYPPDSHHCVRWRATAKCSASGALRCWYSSEYSLFRQQRITCAHTDRTTLSEKCRNVTKPNFLEPINSL